MSDDSGTTMTGERVQATRPMREVTISGLDRDALRQEGKLPPGHKGTRRFTSVPEGQMLTPDPPARPKGE